MTGTAYLTPIAPSVFTSSEDVAAVYAVWPHAQFGWNQTTAYVIVSSSDLVGDTVVHPCDEAGQMLAFDLIAHIPHANHVAALLAAGYELEAVVLRGA